MRPVSNALKTALASGIRNFGIYIDVLLANGTTMTIGSGDMVAGSFSCEQSSSEPDVFTVGCAAASKVSFSVFNISGNFDGINFINAELTVKMTQKRPNANLETFNFGVFDVVKAVSDRSVIKFEAYGRIQRLNRPYSLSTLTYPATLHDIVSNAFSDCGLVLTTGDFTNRNYVVQSRPTDDKLTYGQVVAHATQLAGSFLKENADGTLSVAWYDFDNPYDLPLITSCSVSESDVQITGVGITNSEEVLTMSGDDAYMIEISGNSLISDAEVENATQTLGTLLIGMTFRPADISTMSNPILEVGDVIRYTDVKGNQYVSFVSSCNFTFDGGNTITCDAETEFENQNKPQSQLSQVYARSRKYANELVYEEQTDRHTAEEELNRKINTSAGMYQTSVQQSDGSYIYYIHDKQTLANSVIIIKITADAIGISSDGGQTYSYGLDARGNAILNRIYAEGLDATFINSGTFTARNAEGQTVFSVNVETGEVLVNATALQINSQDVQGMIDSAARATEQYMRYSDGVLEFGSSESPLKLKQQFNRIYFDVNGSEVMYINVDTTTYKSNIVITDAEFLESIKLGNIKMKKTASNGIVFLKE